METRISQACQDIAFSAEALLRRERMQMGSRQQAPALREAVLRPSAVPPTGGAAQQQAQSDAPPVPPVEEVQAVRQVIDQRLETLNPVDSESGVRSRGLLLQLRGLLGQIEARLRGRRDST